MITICMTYFRSLTLDALRAALYSVRQQDLTLVVALVLIDNNTADADTDIKAAVDELHFPMPVFVGSFKHGDKTKTHSWSTNRAIDESPTEWVLFTRADYLLEFSLLGQFTDVVKSHPIGWNGFITANVYHLSVDLARCEDTQWRLFGPGHLRALPGSEEDYTEIDTGVWMARKSSFDAVKGLDESLTAWGHAQTHFQHKLYQSGVEFVRIPKALFYHPKHGAERDMAAANAQLAKTGVGLKEMWARSHVHPYGK